MVFDHPGRRDALAHVVQLDIDVQGIGRPGPIDGRRIANRLGWSLESSNHCDGDGIAPAWRPDGCGASPPNARPVEEPSTHPGSIVGLRLVCRPEHRAPLCVILCGETGGCMRLEAGGMARMELVEQVVTSSIESAQREVSRTLRGGHDSTNPCWPPASRWHPDCCRADPARA